MPNRGGGSRDPTEGVVVRMDGLQFGERTRRRALRKSRRRKIMVAGWILGIVGTGFGLPGPTSGLAVLGKLAGDNAHQLAPRNLRSAAVETSESAESMMKFRTGVFEVRPTPTPTPSPTPEAAVEVSSEEAVVPPPPPPPSGSIEEIIYAAASAPGVDGAYLVSIAACESGLNPSAYNPAGYYGLFQFSQSTWASYGSGDIFDPAAQASAAASMIAAGGAGHWPNCA